METDICLGVHIDDFSFVLATLGLILLGLTILHAIAFIFFKKNSWKQYSYKIFYISWNGRIFGTYSDSWSFDISIRLRVKCVWILLVAINFYVPTWNYCCDFIDFWNQRKSSRDWNACDHWGVIFGISLHNARPKVDFESARNSSCKLFCGSWIFVCTNN